VSQTLIVLSELPEARRTVLVLRHVIGWSIQEIAEYTSVSVNTVKDRLLSARDQSGERDGTPEPTVGQPA
jgi:DNA-directed RNA polymerase specialized sigma24 family protein